MTHILSQTDIDVARSLGSLEASNAALVASFNQLRREVEKIHDPLDKRLTHLEQWQSKLIGASVIGAAAVSFLIPYVQKLV